MKTLFPLLLLSTLHAAPLLPPTGNQVKVATVAQLVTAVNTAPKGSTIMLADGDYLLAPVLPLRFRTDSVMLYGASQDPAKVRLKGGGFGSSNVNEEIIKVEAKGVRFAYFTLRDGRANGLKLQTGGNDGMLVHNVYFIDICERSIKAPDQAVSYWGEVRHCLFEQVTPITSSIPSLNDGGNYIAGIDAMKIDGWSIHDNVFKNIRGMTGGGRAAIFLWNGCRRVTIERNVFTGCDRSIALGNSLNTNTGMDSGAVRNNFISAGKDISLEICNSQGNQISGNQVTGSPSYYRTLSLVNNGANVMRGNIIQGKISLISGQLPDTAGNLWITDAGITGSIQAPKVDTVPRVPLPPVVITRDSIVYLDKPYPVPGPVRDSLIYLPGPVVYKDTAYITPKAWTIRAEN